MNTSDFGAHTLNEMFLSKSSLRGSSIYAEEEVERVRSQGLWLTLRKVSPRHDRPEAQMNSQRLGQHTWNLHRFKTDKIPALKRGNRQKVPPKTEAVCSWYLMEKKINLLQWSVTGYSNNIQGRPHGKALLASTKQPPSGLGLFEHFLFWDFGFCFFAIVLVFVRLPDFLYISLFACFDFQVLTFVIVFHVFIVVVLGENMGREVGRTWQDLRRQKKMIKIIV